MCSLPCDLTRGGSCGVRSGARPGRGGTLGGMNELLSAHTSLRDFRADFYACLSRRGDALFDLTDALLTADAVPSPVPLRLVPAHRRGWGSLSAALAQGRVEVAALRDL